MGEHSVVYGYPAILASIDRRLQVTVTTSDSYPSSLLLNFPEAKIIIEKCIEVVKKATNISSLPNLSIEVHSDIPIGCGLGSSAALAVCAIAALLKVTKNIWNPIKVNELAYEVEKFQHGNPSGGDNTVVCFGGLLWYRKEVEFLKSIWNLPVSSYHIPKLLLIDSGRPKESTGEMVSKVKELHLKKTHSVDEIFKDQERLTRDFLTSLKEGNNENIHKDIYKAEQNLEDLGVVSSSAKKIIRKIEELGGVAKISGAGGSETGSGSSLRLSIKR
jgi:mevalonate kinase